MSTQSVISLLPEHIQQHFTWFKQMRETQPVLHDSESGLWHVFRYDDVNHILHNPAVFSSHAHALLNGSPEEIENDAFGQSFLAMDPPRHRLYRGLVSQAFTPRTVSQLAPRIELIAQSLIDQIIAKGSMEVVRDLSYPLPATVIAELLGVPLERREQLRKLTAALVREQDQDGNTMTEQQAIEEMSELFTELLHERRKHPQEDMMSSLVTAEMEGQHLTDQEMVSFCILLFIAGHETTTKLLASFLLCLAEHADFQQRLLAEPQLISTAVEEVLRTIPPVFSLPRLTTTDVTIADTHIPAGQLVLIWLASANYDPNHFSEPDAFDIARAPNRHLSFGHGIHICLGAPLARLETTIVVQLLLRQFTQLQRIQTEPVTFSSLEAVFGVRRLAVSFTNSKS